MSDIDPVIFEFHARVNGFLADINRTTKTVDQKLGLQEKRVKSLEMQMQRSSTAIGGHLRGLAGTLATYFTGRELVGLLDSFTRLQNNLRVAGLEGENLATVQRDLLQLSQKYGVSIEELSNLYGKATQSASDLGASSAEMLQVTEASAQALKITGTSAAQAQGALLGLTQAFSSGIVRAEEFNQINEGGLRPLLQVVANTERFSGSVGKLRAAVVDGKVSSEEFFKAILSGADTLENKAAKAAMTLTGGFTALTSALTVYFGEADKANGVSAALGEAMGALADNLDTLIPVLAVVGAAVGVGYVTNLIAARTATLSLTTATSSMVAALGGPVGIAITAVIASLAMSAAASREAEAAMLANARAAEELGLKLSKAEKAALEAAGETKGMGNDASRAEPKIWSFANAVDGLTKSLWEQAKAARAARIELLQQQESKADDRIRAARANTTQGQAELASQGARAIGQGDILGGLSDIGGAAGRRLNNFFRGGKPAQQAKTIIDDANKLRQGLVTEIERLKNTPIGAADLEGSSPSSASAGNQSPTKKTPRGRSGTSAAEVSQRHAGEVARLEQEELQARIQITDDVNERADLERQLLSSEFSQRKSAIDQNTDLSAEQKDAQIKILRKLYGIGGALDEQGAILVNGKPALYAQQIERERQAKDERNLADVAETRFQTQMDALRLQYDLADTAAKRQQVALKILAAEDEFLRSKLEAVTNSNVANAVAKEQARIALEALEATAGQRRQSVLRDNETASERYIRNLSKSPEQINEAIDGIKIDGLESLNDGLVDAITGVKSLGDAFKSAADQIISDLLRIAIQQAIIKPLASSLLGGIGGLFGGAAGSTAGITTMFNPGSGLNNITGRRASGGPVSAGGTYLVGERGPELLRMGGGNGLVIPNNMIGGGGSRVVQNVTIKVDANGALLAGHVEQMVQRGMQYTAQLATVAGAAEGERRVMSRGRRRLPG